MHAAAMISLVGAVGVMSRLAKYFDSPLRLATISQVVMSVVLISCWSFVRSFIAVRRSNMLKTK